MSDLRRRAINTVLRRFVRPRLEAAPSAQAARADFAMKMALLPGPPEDIAVTAAEGAGCPVERLSAPAAAQDRAVIYIHGGAYIMGSPATHRSVTWRLARMTGAPVHAPDYRLAPEHPFPAAVEDVLSAYAMLLEQGIAPGRIALAGESAGGGLVLSLVLAARRAGLPDPGAMVLFSPWTDMTFSGASFTDNREAEPMLPAARAAETAGFYLGDSDPRDPLASPLFGDWRAPPPALIHASTIELIRDDAVRMAAVLRAGGGQVRLTLWPDLPHAWQLGAAILPEARSSLRAAAGFIRRHTGAEAVT